eukprot:403358114
MARAGKGKISELDKKYFREIFLLHANKDEKIDYEALCRIFEMVDFKPNEKQEVEFKAMFTKKEQLSFADFLQIFSLKSNNQYNEIDVKNAFRLLSKEYERPGFIRLDRVKDILGEMGLQDVEILQLTNQLNSLCDDHGMFNFEEFVKSAF